MSPLPSPALPSPAATRTVDRLALTLGIAVRDGRLGRSWALRELSRRAGISVATAHHVEAGRAASLETYARLATALGLRLDATILDPKRLPTAQRRNEDPVHAAMGEVEVTVLRSHAFRVAIDEPYQHYQFAGRADLVAWSETGRSLLHLENRTRFPNLQDAVGAFNAKRAYLGSAIAERLRLPAWRSETHVIVVAWTAEAMRDIRRYEASMRSTCPDSPRGFDGWWSGDPPVVGRRTELVVLDPARNLGTRKRCWVDLDHALAVRPRHRGYAALVEALGTGTSQPGIGASR